MRNFDALKGYPEPKTPRVAGPNVRTIHNRIVASYHDKEFFDGDRNSGYGGYSYDGRWRPIAENMSREYGLGDKSSVLQIGCEKGFLLHDFLMLHPTMMVCGTEVTDYPISTAMDSVKANIHKAPHTALPFEDKSFDFVIAIAVVYNLNLADAIKCLREIQRVSKGKSFITLASYTTERSYRLFRNWTLTGATTLREEDWIAVLEHVGYTGDYKLTTAESLNLIEEQGSGTD